MFTKIAIILPCSDESSEEEFKKTTPIIEVDPKDYLLDAEDIAKKYLIKWLKETNHLDWDGWLPVFVKQDDLVPEDCPRFVFNIKEILTN